MEQYGLLIGLAFSVIGPIIVYVVMEIKYYR